MIGKERPSLIHLNQHVLKPVAKHWYELGINLLETSEELDILQTNYPNNVEACCIEMFQLWLQRQPKASWNQLINTLRKDDIKLKTEANEIEQKLLRTPELGMYVIILCINIATK